jgi:hypothetical protein
VNRLWYIQTTTNQIHENKGISLSTKVRESLTWCVPLQTSTQQHPALAALECIETWDSLPPPYALQTQNNVKPNAPICFLSVILRNFSKPWKNLIKHSKMLWWITWDTETSQTKHTIENSTPKTSKHHLISCLHARNYGWFNFPWNMLKAASKCKLIADPGMHF